MIIIIAANHFGLQQNFLGGKIFVVHKNRLWGKIWF